MNNHGTANMALAHLTSTARYAEPYQVSKNLTMIDNGAAEGAQVDNVELVNAASFVKAQEIILPDYLGDAMETKILTNKFFCFYQEDKTLPQFNFMGVVQGRNLLELQHMVDFYLDYSLVTTIGIPRWTITKFEQGAFRIDFAQWLNKNYPQLQIHLLGASPAWPQEILRAAKYAPFIRSCDTSLPYNYAIHQIYLNEATRAVVKRPKNYFETTYYHLLRDSYVKRNVGTMKSWALGLA
jgi:hypothetical protein